VHPFDESHSFDLDDVARVNNLHEAPLLDMLQRRYDMDKIYTYAANVLISINPYKQIPYLYDIGDGPVDVDPENPAPHVYTVSEKAFRALQAGAAAPGGKPLDRPRDQSVIVSGESGAGKTEASKFVMQYLLAASRWHAQSVAETKADDELGNYIQDVLLQSNTVLEAFGNAKTIRNDNSSRFGKYTMLLVRPE
jgi:myosin-5